MLIKRFRYTDKDILSINISRRWAIRTGASTLILAITGTHLTFGSTIVAIRVWPSKDYTRVTLETDTVVQFQQTLIDNPNRFVIDLNTIEMNATLRDLGSKIQSNDPQISQVRVGQFKPSVVRMVFDLKTRVKPQSFTLPPVAGYRYRTVFDLYPTIEPDPLMELLAKSEHKNEALSKKNGILDPETSEAFFQKYAQENTKPLPSAGQPDTAEKLPTVTQRNDPEKDNATFARTRATKTIRLLTIALDPGHGGEDPGAIGHRGSYEKVVVLQIAKRLRDKIDAQPNMRAMMTRDADFFVPLAMRVQKARRVDADLFISIHADAFTTPDARGSSVFTLSEHGASSMTARLLEKTQNASDLIGGVNFRTNDRAVAHALLDMSTTAQIRDSKNFGSTLLRQISDLNKLHSPNVEQASFAVLKAPDIPSVLVETAFISNPEEERRLNDPVFQEQLADALLKGIKQYFAKNPPISKNRTT
ncbi:N-acetylmuramoyl-L-alanine amidase [Candidatus Pandoraea novymonadis]|uniref:N-acetylmuramoyl-L-alanine amidase n=1 Tax=Candidatus Pandoraea novymonadis TaxID=1808959 RepID=A0ABX5FE10_9BURK|nr:N-acetylmuramoyl-L-alanine amidase [Candidatus Pandoraea novymonadis]PSB91889.1 N-acetylmuramoyl-L-alanine amidase AmiC [Candidatus Pandoraea novymonadis]